MTAFTGQFTFTFDQARCTGCKACQIACKDDNALPVGVNWRRVYETTGADWVGNDPLTARDMFTYYTSISCNHCTDPICVQVCPSTAMRKGEAGLVSVDQGICIGCGYCAMACPYEAPQYRPDLGVMSKCDGCLDRITAGEAAACVAACPTRALGFDISQEQPQQVAVAPLPRPELTRPNLRLQLHPRAKDGAGGTTRPRFEPGLTHEAPLAVFTVLAQASAGLVASLAAACWVRPIGERGMAGLPLLVAVVAGLLMAAGMAVSTLHLGSPLRAANALRNLRSSWLSREIAAAGAFVASLAALAFVALVLSPLVWLSAFLATLAAAAGGLLVYAIGRVYTLPTVPVWASGQTLAGFVVTAGAVGPALFGVLAEAVGSDWDAAPFLLASAAVLGLGRLGQHRHLNSLAGGGEAAEHSRRLILTAHRSLRSWWRWSSGVGILVLVAAVAVPPAQQGLASIGVMAVATSELIGRVFFYRSMIREGR